MTGRTDSIVFTPAQIGHLSIKNRLVRSATFENAATTAGEVSDDLVALYRDLAKGGIGLIITGIACVYGKAVAPRQVRIDDDRYIEGLRRIPIAAREAADDCRIIAQLHHPGRQVIDLSAGLPPMPPALIAYLQRAQLPPQPPDGHHVEIEPTAPSPVPDSLFQRTPRALTVEEIEEIVQAYAEAIRRIEEAGFDGVQLHAAHGWLLSSFLSPHTNRRDDDYGGSTENRARIIRDIYDRARKMVDASFPILIKINTTDFIPGGTDAVEAAEVAAILAETGFAAIEASGGMWEALTRDREELGWLPVMIPEARVGIKTREQEAYFLDGARAVKNRITAPVILVGGMRSIGRIEEVLASGAADFVAMSRPLIRQPDLPKLWLTGKESDKAACISCNACLPIGASRTRCNAQQTK
jgi:2,4-dienoyl-CoA reductase-like NADH-dependent reductase (Old Yellow Enzyme family)